MDTPFFSIVIPTYNRAYMLPKAIESVIKQSFSDWELIIIDDGSTDNTKEIVENYKDTRIKYYYQKNQERSTARNNGIKNAKGEYICFLDSDDYFLPKHLEVFNKEIIKQNKPIAFFFSKLCSQMNDGSLEYNKNDIPFQQTFEFVLDNIIHSQQVCIHNKILKKHYFNPKFHIGEDLELWIRIWDEFPVTFINEHTVVVVYHNDRTIGYLNLNAYSELLPLTNFIFSKGHPGHKIKKSSKKYIKSKVLFNIARCYIYNQQKWSAIKYLIYSIIIKPFNILTKHKVYLIFNLLFKPTYCHSFKIDFDKTQ